MMKNSPGLNEMQNLESGIEIRLKQIELEQEQLNIEIENLKKIFNLEPRGLEELICKMYLEEKSVNIEDKKANYRQHIWLFETEFFNITRVLKNKKILNIYKNKKTFNEDDIREVITEAESSSVIVIEAKKKLLRYLKFLDKKFDFEAERMDKYPGKYAFCICKNVYDYPVIEKVVNKDGI